MSSENHEESIIKDKEVKYTFQVLKEKNQLMDVSEGENRVGEDNISLTNKLYSIKENA